MTITIRFLPALCLAAGACTAALVVPDAIAPGSDERLARVMSARGVQIYECLRHEGDVDAYQWSFVAPEAELLDRRGKVVGHHGAGPTWQADDGSRILGTFKARADAPSANAIPWLLLSAKSVGRAGTFSDVTSVQRVNTIGGVAPGSGCTRDNVGRQIRVAYLADYRFFVR